MPLNVLRLNQRHQHPTERIVFIKVLPGEDAPIATEFLNRVAAICHPILKNNHLSVTTLEEHEPNREFLGRNFNNGECIQLILKSHGGSWLSFRSVVMVMMHELAHNSQMNHSRAFWKIRNQYAEEMKALWARGYTGEGIWGPGREVETGIRVGGGREVETEMPEHLCGGTFRSRRRKRVRGPKLSWKEQKERRIVKKFGVNGKPLGEDEVERQALQGFKGPTTKSRVAGSKRGRELRAAAALARFDKAQAEPVKGEPHDADEDGFAESDDEYEDADAGLEDAKDTDGSQLKDGKGQGMVRICEDEDVDDVLVKAELDDLNYLDDIPAYEETPAETIPAETTTNGSKGNMRRKSQPFTYQELVQQTSSSHSNPPNRPALPAQAGKAKESEAHLTKVSDLALFDQPAAAAKTEQICSVCSMENDAIALLCAACSNVLNAERCPGSWKCKTESCAAAYRNPADFGLCGICGNRRG